MLRRQKGKPDPSGSNEVDEAEWSSTRGVAPAWHSCSAVVALAKVDVATADRR
jgi:hypothetical protein